MPKSDNGSKDEYSCRLDHHGMMIQILICIIVFAMLYNEYLHNKPWVLDIIIVSTVGVHEEDTE